MKIQDLHEAYDLSKARIDHPEDLVITAGSQGARLAVDLLEEAVKHPDKMSMKPDGKPAILWGMDAGGFAMGDKHMKQLPHSLNELHNILAARKGGGREDLMSLYTKLWPIFKSSVKSVDGYLFGDLLYSSLPPVRDNHYVIMPNTVEYSIPVNSALGKRVGSSFAGIVVHSLIDPSTRTGKHIDDISKVSGVVVDSPLLMISDSLPLGIKIKEPNLSKLKSAINSKSNAIDSFLNDSELTAKKIKALPELLKKYVNARVKTRSFDNMPNGFIMWLSENTTVPMAAKIKEHVSQHKLGYSALWNVFVMISEAKNAIVNQLDAVESEIVSRISGERGNEGYIVHSSQGPVKLVNRFKFSATHFSH